MSCFSFGEFGKLILSRLVRVKVSLWKFESNNKPTLKGAFPAIACREELFQVDVVVLSRVVRLQFTFANKQSQGMRPAKWRYLFMTCGSRRTLRHYRELQSCLPFKDLGTLGDPPQGGWGCECFFWICMAFPIQRTAVWGAGGGWGGYLQQMEQKCCKN